MRGAPEDPRDAAADSELERQLRAIEQIAGAYRSARNDPAPPEPGGHEATPHGPAPHDRDPRAPVPHETRVDASAPTGVPAPAATRGNGEMLFRWGPLEVLEPLGEGTFGEIFRAFDPALQREVALKLYKRPSSSKALARDAGRGDSDGESSDPGLEEARRMARIRHPNVLAVHGVDVCDGRLGIWTDLLEGETLEARLKSAGPMSDREAALLGIDLCRALAAIHGVGLVHGDVKTANVMRESGGAIVLLDFSSGRELEVGSRRGGMSGTPLVSPPEVLVGHPPDRSSDLYALGVLLFRMVTARYPVEATALNDLLAKHESGERLRLRDLRPDLSSAFIRAVERALEPRRTHRIHSAAELEHLLDHVIRPPSRNETVRIQVAPGPRQSFRLDTARPAGNLPSPLSRILGRETELGQIAERLARGRLITLVGAGGVGKTRLAMESGHRVTAQFEDGVWWTDLTPLRTGDRVVEELAVSLGLSPSPKRDPFGLVLDRLAGVRALLVFDNCEHLLLEAARVVQDLLTRLPQLTVLATSREHLGVEGEEVVFVGPLPVPGRNESVGSEACLELFERRARLVDPQFAVTAENAPTVIEVCARLDGIPLAIELAAARVQLMPVDAIRDRLEDRFRLLDSGDVRGPAHHRTLEALLDWDDSLLSDEERRVFRRLSIFAGGWTLEIAEELRVVEPELPASIESGAETPSGSVMNVLGRLIDRSLVHRTVAAGRRAYRFHMLETIREYARRKLQESGEEVRLRALQGAYYRRMAEEAREELYGPQSLDWMQLLRAEHENLSEVLHPAHLPGAAAARSALEILLALWRYYWLRGSWQFVVTTGAALLDAAELDRDDPVRARVLTMLGGFHHWMGWDDRAIECLESAFEIQKERPEDRDLALTLQRRSNLLIRMGEADEARELADRALRIYQREGDLLGQATTHVNLFRIEHHLLGRHQTAERHLQESLQLHRRIGHEWGVASVLHNLGAFLAGLDRAGEARRMLEEGVELLRRLDDGAGVTMALYNLSVLCTHMKDYDRAREYALESRRLATRSGDRRGRGSATLALGNHETKLGRLDEGGRLLLEVLTEAREVGDRLLVAQALEGLGAVAQRRGRIELAARVLGAASRARAEAGAPPIDAVKGALVEVSRIVQDELGAPDFERLFESGRLAETAETIESLLEESDSAISAEIENPPSSLSSDRALPFDGGSAHRLRGFHPD